MLSQILIDALYLLALINPVSKIAVLSTTGQQEEEEALLPVALRASAIAAGICLACMLGGDFVLRSVFKVDLHALRISGGLVLTWVGFNALRKGVFFEQDLQGRFADLSIVPLACPMIAGPATITASIALASEQAGSAPFLALVIAIATNLGLMLLARPIAAGLRRFNLLGALIRITGLVVMTMGVQMVLNGLAEWGRAK